VGPAGVEPANRPLKRRLLFQLSYGPVFGRTRWESNPRFRCKRPVQSQHLLRVQNPGWPDPREVLRAPSWARLQALKNCLRIRFSNAAESGGAALARRLLLQMGTEGVEPSGQREAVLQAAHAPYVSTSPLKAPAGNRTRPAALRGRPFPVDQGRLSASTLAGRRGIEPRYSDLETKPVPDLSPYSVVVKRRGRVRGPLQPALMKRAR
jgi:hypothetical protein